MDAIVTITVEVDGNSKTFTASTATDGSPHRAADSLLSALRGDAGEWVRERSEAARGRPDRLVTAPFLTGR
ncbi:hypothetical protein [Catenuloplanes indicus]|uniref:Uncharacterized protein n=1 Tax=Catenuloplanes indicus TaxID=137267 RepID=A0AAE3VU38_9ACTN|nr:hypothetical protein [Catenuloplanes indicus]MDQ0363344.1 hypothetical protein [Catenuloplanes indicus]MDQ0371666.1 hypothetical protein [Catenuloplanes indicus]